MRRSTGVAGLAWLAVACSHPHAGTLPSPSPAVSTRTPSPPTPAAQIEAAAREYYAALQKAGQTGETSALKSMVAHSCECTRTLDYIDAEARQGHHFTTAYLVDGVTVHSVTTHAGFATVTLSYGPSTVVDRAGRVVRRIAGKQHAARDLGFVMSGQRWRLVRLIVIGG